MGVNLGNLGNVNNDVGLGREQPALTCPNLGKSRGKASNGGGMLNISNRMDWETPQWIFSQLDEQYGFGLDAAASDENRLCERWYTESDDGLTKKWSQNTWVNPPYARHVGDWVAKAAAEAEKWKVWVAIMINAKTDTKYWHDIVMAEAHRILFVRGRVKFLLQGKPYMTARSPSCVVVFGPGKCCPSFGALEQAP